MPDSRAGAAHPFTALEPTAHALEVPAIGSDEDSPWSADEPSGSADAAFGAVDFVSGPITIGPAEPDQAEQSVMPVSSSVSQLQDSQLQDEANIVLQRMPAEELAQPMEQDASSPEAVQAAAAIKLSKPVAELTQQVPAGELPGHHTPALQQTAGAALAGVVGSPAVKVSEEHSVHLAAPTVGQAAYEEGSLQEGGQPTSSTPLYTCHLQGLGGDPLDMFSQEDVPSAGGQLVPHTAGSRRVHFEA